MTPAPYNPTAPLPPERPGPRPGDPAPPQHAREWLTHVEAGRIGNTIPATPEQRARHARNEQVFRNVFCR